MVLIIFVCTAIVSGRERAYNTNSRHVKFGVVVTNH
jgi:hypothetical protein